MLVNISGAWRKIQQFYKEKRDLADSQVKRYRNKSKEQERRENYKRIFERAAKGPVPVTYATNPLLQK